jgi:choline-sulfatase
MGKQNLYDHSVRMPLIVAGPGVPANRRVDHLVYQHSLFATTCELAGVAAPPSLEFPSLAGLLHGDRAAPHDAVFCYYLDYQRSVRTAEHKLIVYPQARVTQLFDLHRDPRETRNLACSRPHAPLRPELLERLHRFQKVLDDPLPPVLAT